MNWEILIPLFGIAMPVGIVWIIYDYDNRAKQQFHATLQKLIESGQELSPELLESVPGYKAGKKDKDDIRSGLITSGVGIGIALFGHFGVGEQPLFGIGLLVLSIGVGMLAYGIYSKNKKGDDLS
ncbi:MAG TPA: DUF202 domain-containing protein [Gemmatimonadetes bacterium]|nr:DUF202 domain-containing protein [Gemmatimonadota bacterium]